MKKRRLLAFVLCLIMIFGDLTNTFASTVSDSTVVVTDTETAGKVSESETSESETVVTTESEKGEETDVESGTVSETENVSESETGAETEKPSDTEEVVETETEIETETTEESTELQEEIRDVVLFGEGETPTVTVDYWIDDENSGAVGEGYVDILTAMTGIEEFLAANAGFAGHININLNEDAEGSSLAISDAYANNVKLMLHLNGHTLTLVEDTYVRANIDGYVYDEYGNVVGEAGTIVAGNYTLNLLPGQWSVDEDVDTHITNTQLSFGTESASGSLILGEKEYNGALSGRQVDLTNVKISNVNNWTAVKK